MISDRKLHRIISEVLEKQTGAGQEEHDDDYYNHVEFYNDPKLRSGKEWAEKGGNFAVKRNGRVYYISRSVAVSLYCYCRNGHGEWCVLANKRGPGAPNANNLWNVPCGYLDYDETTDEAVLREAFEETGVRIPKGAIQMMGVNSQPHGNSQNVTVRYAGVLRGTTDDYPTSMDNCEPGEVSAVGWIPLSKVSKLQWAFEQKPKILSQAKTCLRNIDFKTEDTGEMIKELRRLLSNNPRCLSLFNGILKNIRYK